MPKDTLHYNKKIRLFYMKTNTFRYEKFGTLDLFYDTQIAKYEIHLLQILVST